jgi:hypothetical protein
MGDYKIARRHLENQQYLQRALPGQHGQEQMHRRCKTAGVTTQEWIFTYTSNGYNSIRNVGTGDLLDVVGSSKTAGARLVQDRMALAVAALERAQERRRR